MAAENQSRAKSPYPDYPQLAPQPIIKPIPTLPVVHQFRIYRSSHPATLSHRKSRNYGAPATTLILIRPKLRHEFEREHITFAACPFFFFGSLTMLQIEKGKCGPQ